MKKMNLKIEDLEERIAPSVGLVTFVDSISGFHGGAGSGHGAVVPDEGQAAEAAFEAGAEADKGGGVLSD